MRLSLLTAACMMAAVPAGAAVVGGFCVTPQECTVVEQRRFAVGNVTVDFRDDLTRVALTFEASPHTAHRIDAVTLCCDGEVMEAVDLDGADMGLWFQTEDEGTVDLEIDFGPVANRTAPLTLIFTTPYGEATFCVALPQTPSDR